MSELTYKKIIDVEQVEALNDAATVFINDNGAMKQVAADKFGAVKTVNGVEPDENGDVQIETGAGGSGGAKMAIMRSSKYLDALQGNELPEGDETWECLNMTYSEAKAIITSGGVLPFALQLLVEEDGLTPMMFYGAVCILYGATDYKKEHIVLNANYMLFWTEDGISMDEPFV